MKIVVFLCFLVIFCAVFVGDTSSAAIISEDVQRLDEKINKLRLESIKHLLQYYWFE